MKTDWRRVNRTLEAAERDGRNFLLEPEVYQILEDAGIRAPRHVFIPAGRSIVRKDLIGLGTAEVVLKVVSPLIIHKSDVGGVAFVQSDAAAVNRA
ncbi:MAG: acetate--CoA ligase family protein, partial [Candidatus Aminicenantes bacterium]|nr:acetate--CoA ligase family protein [Candidatus Aminicenantes bacterium]